jgi:hypothetical protein
MKINFMRLLFILLAGLSFHSAKSQCGTLSYHGMIPSPIYDTTHSALNLQVYCNEAITLQTYNVNLSGNTLTVDAYYCYGWLQVIQTTNDTIPIGLLTAGNYSYTANIYISYAPVTNCLSYTPYTSGTNNFTVLPFTNSVTEKSEIDFNIFPNPSEGLFTITNSEKINELILYSLDGKIQYQSDQSSSTVTIPDEIANGIYLLEIRNESGSKMERISLHR